MTKIQEPPPRQLFAATAAERAAVMAERSLLNAHPPRPLPTEGLAAPPRRSVIGLGARLRAIPRLMRWAARRTVNLRERVFGSSLRLELGFKTVTFNTLQDFEFSLDSRSELPVAKVAYLMELPADALRQEVLDIGKVEKHFAGLLARTVGQAGDINQLMYELNPRLFSQDHQWRDIFRALRDQGPRFDAFKKIALAKYMQYLSSRQNLVKNLCLAASRESGGRRAADGRGRSAGSALKKTATVGLTLLNPRNSAGLEYQRLPRGEPVCVRLSPDCELEIMLAKYRFKLVLGTHLYLVDDRGSDYQLSPGKNMVGRQAGNDVPIDGIFRGISRTHVIIEQLGDDRARLTDLSSHGTFIPRHHTDVVVAQG